MDSSTLTGFGLVLLFVLVGGVFAATELALVSLRDSQLSALERQSGRGAKVAKVARDPNRFLAAVQIGVTVVGFLSAAYGGSTLAPAFSPYLVDAGLSEGAADTTALIVLTLLIAYLSLVFGELVPKRLALQKSQTIALAVTPILDRFATLMRPVIWLLSLSTNVFVRLLGGDPHAAGEQLSEEELRELVSTHDDLEDDERRLLQEVFEATETPVKRVMRPRTDVAFLDGSARLADVADEVRDQPYSRYPVTGEGFDDVIGLLHIRDLLGLEAGDQRRVAAIARPILRLPSTVLLLPAIAQMREENTHMAIVVDEYGGTDGIVTLEDLVEELVGEITDEYDLGEQVSLDPDHVPGSLTLPEFEEASEIALEEGDYETVAGFVIAALGRIPQVGEVAEFPAGSLEVTEMSGHRIVSLRLTRAAAEPS